MAVTYRVGGGCQARLERSAANGGILGEWIEVGRLVPDESSDQAPGSYV